MTAHVPALAAQSVSLMQLMATPERYEGKEVYVVGFMHLEFEGDVLYTYREDWTQNLMSNGIWLDVDSKKYQQTLKLNNNYVVIEGTFTTKLKGHLGMYAGAITNIVRVNRWGRPKR